VELGDALLVRRMARRLGAAMPALTFDGQSLLVDGKRLWLVGGTIHSARLTRDTWEARILAAKAAGLNCITLPIVWARHEPRPGAFDFTGDNDIRHFVQLVAKHHLHAIVRLGPFVGEGYDLGGIPPWALGLKDLVSLRSSSQAYLEAASRFFGAVAKQLRDLQISVPQSPGDTVGGPIVLVQSEHEWFCGSQAKATSYLAELNRYIHESGFEVPILNANNLWQGAEGEIDSWVGNEELLGFMRQLATVRPGQPRIVSKVNASMGTPVWGEPLPPVADGRQFERLLAEIIAGAGQFNIENFVGGTNFAFSGGRLPGGPGRFVTTASDHGSMIDAAGRQTELYEPVRLIATFASRFSRVLSHLDPKAYAVGLHPDLPARGSAGAKASGKGAKSGGAYVRPHSVMHASGSQGSVAFIFAGENMGEAPATLLLSNGTQLPVYLDDAPAAWVLLDVRLAGRSHLDYCNLSAFALVGKVFVCFGPAGTPAKLSINGAPIEVTVPEGDEPLVIEHENVHVVIAGRHQLGRIHVGEEVVALNVAGMTPDGHPLVEDAKVVVTRLFANGDIVRSRHGEKPPAPPAPVVAAPEPEPVKGKGKAAGKVAAKSAAKVTKKGAPVVPAAAPVVAAPVIRPSVQLVEKRKAAKPIELHNWVGADLAEYVGGRSARFAGIAGPAELANLGAPYGYGWYRVTNRAGASGRVELTFPLAGDRLHLFIDGKAAGIIGRGPGATATLGVTLKKRDQMIVILAENAGRFAGGAHMLDAKGCTGHAWEVAEARGVSKPALAHSTKMNVLQHVPFAPGVHDADQTDAIRPTWTITKRKGPTLLKIAPGAFRGLLLVNGVVVRYCDASGPGSILLSEEQLGKASNTIEVAILGDATRQFKAIVESVELLDCLENLTEKADWAFAKWERPSEAMFHALRGHSHGRGPEWFRTTFACTGDGPLAMTTTGLSKGQVYVNGRHIGRYFSATHDGKAVGPQTELVIPTAALKAGEGNELLIFDEHGHLPSKVRLVYRS
jgi:hypothetical protein